MSELEIKYRIVFIALLLMAGVGSFLFIKYIRAKIKRAKAERANQTSKWPILGDTNLTTQQNVLLIFGVVLVGVACFHILGKTRNAN